MTKHQQADQEHQFQPSWTIHNLNYTKKTQKTHNRISNQSKEIKFRTSRYAKKQNIPQETLIHTANAGKLRARFREALFYSN